MYVLFLFFLNANERKYIAKRGKPRSLRMYVFSETARVP
jgi:hypothetical protein